jgi:hypothetical protein
MQVDMIILTNERGQISKLPGIRAGNNSHGIWKALQDGGIDVSSHNLNDWTQTSTGSVKLAKQLSQSIHSDGEKGGTAHPSNRLSVSHVNNEAAEKANMTFEQRVRYAGDECEHQPEAKLHASNGHCHGTSNAHSSYDNSHERKLEHNYSSNVQESHSHAIQDEHEGEKNAKANAGRLIQVCAVLCFVYLYVQYREVWLKMRVEGMLKHED